MSVHTRRPGIFFLTLLFLFTGFSKVALSQQSKSVLGKVIDQQGNPLVGASVYLSHTSRGVVTSISGSFILRDLPEGKYDLVISAIGFESKVIPVSSDDYPGNLKIILNPMATELAEVVVEPADKNGWRKFGRYFFDNFIGTTRNARYCKIVNQNAVRFRFSEKTNKLIAKAHEPIVIENKALGYKIFFQLVEFTADFNTGTVAYNGYPLFTELKESNVKKQHTIFSNRRHAYNGSLMHFMRAVYEGKLRDESFLVRATVMRPNLEKERVKNILKDTISSRPARYDIANLSFGTIYVTTTSDDTIAIAEDSLSYYKKVLKQRDTLTQVVSLESISELITKVGTNSKFLFFKNTMEVVYFRNNNRKRNVSEIMLATPTELEIIRNGSYFSPKELVTFRYWSESEKMCNMLPLDYNPD